MLDLSPFNSSKSLQYRSVEWARSAISIVVSSIRFFLVSKALLFHYSLFLNKEQKFGIAPALRCRSFPGSHGRRYGETAASG